ncbi:MAG TPA: activating enzyme [Eubacteriaceae bacterium]|jgi:uncharacterized 2Fe-2S/4Fe-4S cluster protein (DUF4445 family)|nr:activating enzyme [Eubacteriaceae bacterium]
MDKKITVKFPILNKSLKVDEGMKVSEACALAGYPLNLVCGGKGTCKKCAVEINESGHLKKILSCREVVYDDMEIMLKEEEQKAQILTSSTLDEIHFNPSIKSIYLNRDDLRTELGQNDWDVLNNKLGGNVDYPTLDIFQKMSFLYHNNEGINVILDKEKIIDILPAPPKSKIYGIAFDLGTTSVVGYLYDLEENMLIGIDSTLNKQTELGGDVISRIDQVISDHKKLLHFQNLAINSLNQIIEDICTKHEVDPDDIYYVSICGNSTMQHLFLGLYPEHLGKAPFTSTTHGAVKAQGKDFGLKTNPRGIVSFLPLLGGFVGADTTAVLLSLPNDGKNRLVIDLGTNGEIAVGKNMSYHVSSTACGPALEGAGIKHGMRGTKGAIEKVSINQGKLSYQVIENLKPKGICGSGVIDLIAVLFSEGVINRRGAFVPVDKIKNDDLAKRMTVIDDQRAFIIAFEDESSIGEDIYFSQKDIRQVQLAKGAIYTGCVMLIEEYGIKGKDLSEIIIAGAFGNYIDIEKAQSIGMLPWFEGVDVSSIGNAAGTGSQMYLLSEEKQHECDLIAGDAVFVELANNRSFATQYMKNTYFKDLRS